MKKILIDLTSLADNFSGIERFALSITKELIKYDNFDYILVFKNEVHDLFKQKRKNVSTIVIPGKDKLIFNQIILPIHLMRIKADKYLFLAFPAPFFFFSRKSISAIHDMGCWDCPQTNKWWMTLYFKVLYRKVACNNKKIITVSEFSKQRIQDILHVSASNIIVIKNGISDVFLNINKDSDYQDTIRKKYSLPERYILCLSTIEPRKNIKLLIQAYSQIVQEWCNKKKNIPYDLVLAGRKGWKTEDIFPDNKKYISERIHYTGFIEEQDLPYIYTGAICFIFPSLYEGFGVPPIEALSCGVGVLSSDAASLPEILKDDVWYFKNNDIEDLKRKLCSVSDIVTHCGVPEKIKQQYSWENEAFKLYEKLYED